MELTLLPLTLCLHRARLDHLAARVSHTFESIGYLARKGRNLLLDVGGSRRALDSFYSSVS